MKKALIGFAVGVPVGMFVLTTVVNKFARSSGAHQRYLDSLVEQELRNRSAI